MLMGIRAVDAISFGGRSEDYDSSCSMALA